MQYTIVTLLATVASYASAQSSASSAAASASQTPIGAVIPLGGDCVPGGTPCALGSQCYATNFMLQPRCGNFQAACTSDQQCAFNTCNLQQGLCNGFLSSSSAPASSTITPTPTGGFTPAPSSTVTAPAGSLPLGAQCNPYVNPSQCIAGVQCWASNAGLIARCGNFNAACSSNAQCAYNTCNNGLCNGFLASSSAGNSTGTASSTGSGTPSNTGSASRTSSIVQFTGAASVATTVPEVMVMVLGVAAWAL
ncbi:hypothetical protein BU25DRAFT_414683 [Macroventuria anomochaeta]|uniref:Uncharacterized protein n=1 Tax=Macroventuria anomochaeta TaxID=301207 RepID=A0ACB6RPU5_9PLEO|nr:uncharacterized protein BU25DRAFT_414683 [Macroventuria anomochaeta]KAF2623174.1 hypothetical protein BU25DRAFT_414683 [Macroventuria anomochaeta]